MIACNNVLHLVEVKLLKKKKKNRAKIRSEISFFCQFLKFSSLVFLEIACNDSLERCLTSSRDETQTKFRGPN